MAEEFLTIAEAAGILKVTPGRVRQLMCSGRLVVGVHFNRPPGMRARFLRSALLRFLSQPVDTTPIRTPEDGACNLDAV